MSVTIETFTIWDKSNVLSAWQAGSVDIFGQTFRPPSSSLALDKSTFYIRNTVNIVSDFIFSASIYTYNTATAKVTGSPLATGAGQFSTDLTFVPVTVDFDDIELNPANTYVVFYQINSQTPGGAWGIVGNQYPQGQLVYSSSQGFPGNAFGNSGGQDWAFIFEFASTLRPSGSNFFVPSANINEGTGIQINVSGTYSGTGTFGIANPDQSGNSLLKRGKYGSLVVDYLTGAFNYTPDQNKIKPLKTGETGVDEFTITLTAANGTVTSSTYRVDIIGDTGSDNGGGGDDKPKNKSISIKGSRGTYSKSIIVNGDAQGFEAGSTVIPYVRFPGGEFTQGTARPSVNSNGDFSWRRKTENKTYVYFTSEDGSVTSNRVIIPAGGAALASSSLKAFDSDPLVGGSSYQHAGHRKGKRRRPVAAVSFGNRLAEDTNSSLLMATDSADAGFYKQHDLVAASSGNW